MLLEKQKKKDNEPTLKSETQKKHNEPTLKSETQKKRRSQRSNKNNNMHTSSELSIAIPTVQEQQDYVEWEDKKLKIQQKNLELLKEEIELREKLQ
ncbi:5631_t:CDS:2, partial [Racocetra fulgida]